MQDQQAKSGNGKRRGGGSSVALLFVAAVPLAAAVFALTQAFLVPADVIAPYVPANAVAYLHASGRAASNAMLSSSVQMPSGVAPDEVAVFAAPGDDALRWAVIVAWRAPKSPSPADRAALQARGAVALDERRFLVGDGSLAVAARVAYAAHASIADVPERRRALGLMRSVAAVQAYADLSALLPADAAGLLAEFGDGADSPVVAGINLGPAAARMRIMSVQKASDEGSWLGFRASSARAGRFDVARFPARIAIAERAPSFDVARLFAGVPQAKDHPAPVLLARAGDDLRAALARPYDLWLRPGAADGRTGYLLRFSDVAPATMREALARYAATINPDRTVFRLPDGDAAIEFRLDEAGRAEKMGTDDVEIALGRGADGAVSIGGDGTGGTLLSSSAALIAEFRAGTFPRDSAPTPCPDRDLRSVIMLQKPAETLSSSAEAVGVISMLNIKAVQIGLSVDNDILVCGYK